MAVSSAQPAAVDAHREIAPADVRQPRRYLVFGIVAIGLFMASVDQTIVATALGTFQHDLGAQVNWSSWTITIYALGQIVTMPLAGRLGDEYGRRRIFLAAVVLFTVASLCCGLAQDIYVLVALRAVQAIGGGAIMPTASGIVAEQFGPDRDRAIGAFTSIFPIGGIVGPVLGGLFITYWSWRGIFLVNVPIGIVLIILAAVFIPHSPRRPRTRFDFAGVGLMAAGLLGVMFAVSYLGGGRGVLAQRVVPAALVCGLGCLAGFVWRAAHAADPFIPMRLLRGHGFAVMNVINFFFGVAALGFGALVPLYAEQRYGIHSFAAGTLLTARAVGMIAVAGVATFALRRTGYRLPMRIGFVVAAIGLLFMAAPPRGLSDYAWLAVSAAVFGIGMGVSIPASNNAIMHLSPADLGAVSGLRGMFRQAGGITGLAVVTAVIARSSDPGLTQAWALVALAVVLICLLPLISLVPDHHGSW